MPYSDYLKHKPVIVSENYEMLTQECSSPDAKGLSLGLAQWDRGKVDISAKYGYMAKMVQATEELPIHRGWIYSGVRLLISEAYRYLSYPDNPVIDRAGSG